MKFRPILSVIDAKATSALGLCSLGNFYSVINTKKFSVFFTWLELSFRHQARIFIMSSSSQRVILGNARNRCHYVYGMVW